MKYENILEGIGSTPHVRINQLFPGASGVWMKLERNNPGGSIKDRIALAMIRDAEEQGILKKGSTIVEPTSGNTGIGLAMVAAVKGYRIILVMPESMSVERRSILKAYGAEIILTPREQGMKGSMKKAEELARDIEGAWIPSQFDNPSNPSVHEETTALEILEDFQGGIDFMVTGVGTGGHISGVTRTLKKKMPGIKVFAVEPAESPVISGGEPAPHGNWCRVYTWKSGCGPYRWGLADKKNRGLRIYKTSCKRGGDFRRNLNRSLTGSGGKAAGKGE